MSKMYLSNAFSLQMLDHGWADDAIAVNVKPLTKEELLSLLTEADKASIPVESHVGHATFATMLTNELGREVSFNRSSTSLELGDVLFVAQYCGGRLPEGVTELPENPCIKYRVITLSNGNNNPTNA